VIALKTRASFEHDIVYIRSRGRLHTVCCTQVKQAWTT